MPDHDDPAILPVLDEAPRYPAEDGPGAGVRVELTVRVLVGAERSTVIVADPISGRALAHEVLPHGGEADLAAAAVEAAVRDWLAIEEAIALVRSAPDVPADPGDEWPPVTGDPGGVPGGRPEAPSKPREEV